MFKTLTLTVALAGVFAASGSLSADAKMRHRTAAGQANASSFVGTANRHRCEMLREVASMHDQHGDNYYTNQYIQCINR